MCNTANAHLASKLLVSQLTSIGLDPRIYTMNFMQIFLDKLSVYL